MKLKGMKMVLSALCVASTLLAMEGKAVTSIRFWRSPQWEPQPQTDRLVVTTMSGTNAIRTDTLLRGERYYHPTWSFNGRRIAFYQSGVGLSMVDENGQNRKVLAKMVDWSWNSGAGREQ